MFISGVGGLASDTLLDQPAQPVNVEWLGEGSDVEPREASTGVFATICDEEGRDAAAGLAADVARRSKGNCDLLGRVAEAHVGNQRDHKGNLLAQTVGNV